MPKPLPSATASSTEALEKSIALVAESIQMAADLVEVLPSRFLFEKDDRFCSLKSRKCPLFTKRNLADNSPGFQFSVLDFVSTNVSPGPELP